MRILSTFLVRAPRPAIDVFNTSDQHHIDHLHVIVTGIGNYRLPTRRDDCKIWMNNLKRIAIGQIQLEWSKRLSSEHVTDIIAGHSRILTSYSPGI